MLTLSNRAGADADSIGARVREATLANGLKILVLPVTKAPVVTLQIWYRVGSRNEKLGTTGLSHLLEHLMFKETDKLKPEEFSRIIQANGGELNAFTTADYTAYFETLSADRLPLALELEADRMSNLKLREETTEPEKRVVMEERRLRSVDNPWGALYEEMNAAAFRAHPYMWPVIGWMSDIQSATLADIRDHYQTYYRPNNAIVVVVGNVDPDATIDRVRGAFGPIAAGPAPRPVTEVEPPQLGERRVIVKKEANLPALVWAYKVPNIKSADSYALEVLSTILSDGESSRLYRKMVIDERLLLDVNADNPLLSLDPNLFTLSGQLLPDKKVEDVEAMLEKEIEAIASRPVSDRELQKAKNQIEAQFVFAQDSNFYQAMLLARVELIGDWRSLDGYLPAIRKVGAEDLRRVARQYLVPDQRTVGVLVPTGPAKHAAAPPSEMLH
ncbi:MAG: insulinase family protein [Deltaproteobacteria bacterium]|nr:insulinase family protein [Deltaproteobacteria bacterium]